MPSLTKKPLTNKNIGRPRRHNAEDRERFLEAFDRLGKVSAAISELGFNRNQCYRWAREANSRTSPAKAAAHGKKKTKYSQAQKDNFFTVLDRLGSVSAAAREVGIPGPTCFQWAYKAGVRSHRPQTGRREEFLRLRATGLSRREAAAAVGAHKRTAGEWDNDIRRLGGKRVYPDGRVVDYKRGVTTHIVVPDTPAMASSPGLSQLQKTIDPRYLSLPEREQIRDLSKAGTSLRAIARVLGRPASTISREISRNSGPVGYQPYAAHRTAAARRPRPKPSKLTRDGPLRQFVKQGLLICWSPEQISKRLVSEFPHNSEMRVSHETIYQSLYVQARGGLKREVQAALRSGRTRRKKHTDPQKRTHRFRDPMINISERPAEVEDRAVPGHWEGDLVRHEALFYRAEVEDLRLCAVAAA